MQSRGAELRLLLAVLRRLHARGWTVDALATDLAISRRTIWRVLAVIEAEGLSLTRTRHGREYLYRLAAPVWLTDRPGQRAGLRGRVGLLRALRDTATHGGALRLPPGAKRGLSGYASELARHGLRLRQMRDPDGSGAVIAWAGPAHSREPEIVPRPGGAKNQRGGRHAEQKRRRDSRRHAERERR